MKIELQIMKDNNDHYLQKIEDLNKYIWLFKAFRHQSVSETNLKIRKFTIIQFSKHNSISAHLRAGELKGESVRGGSVAS